MVDVLKVIADSGINIVAVVDDAYFGMFYGDSITESMFGKLCGLSPNLLPIKLDGPTKEMFVWGFRVGFITFGVNEKETLSALEQKVAGNIRGTISNVSNLSQTLILSTLKDPNFEKEQKANIDIMQARAKKCMEILRNPAYFDHFSPYPFNSGYFLCLKLNVVEAEPLRIYLLDKYGVGTISTGVKDLRIAFSSVELEDLQELFDIIHKACGELAKI
jgi:aspartate/methionine/tyrosine aminotransferase